MYESPIEMICNDIQTRIVKQQENDVYQAVQQYGITVDKEELLKALRYDREQYTKGYNDALDKVKEYIRYFAHMQEEDNKSLLGGMAWDDIVWHIYYATEKYQLFTKNELADMFPDLLGHIREDYV